MVVPSNGYNGSINPSTCCLCLETNNHKFAQGDIFKET